MTKKIRLLVLSFGILIAAIIIWGLVASFQHRGSTKVEILVLPADSSLRIDGQTATPGNTYLKNGTHTLIASRQDFGDDKEIINTSDITNGQTIYLLPTANSAAAKAYLQAHPELQQQREAAGGAEAERIQALLLKQYPIQSKLPQQTLDYKIDYSTDLNQSVSFTITTYGIINGPSDYANYVQQTKDFRQEAITFLQKNGVNTAKASIKYIPSNP